MKLINFLIMIPFFLFSKEINCVFTPPRGFQTQDPKNYPPYIKIAFSGKEQNCFRPTINLAIERNAGDKQGFLDCVTKMQKKRVKSQWKKLSTIKTNSGIAHLFQDEVLTKAGSITIFQAILVKDDVAYTLTANCLKEEMSIFYPLYHKAFSSLTLTDDLFSLIKDKKKKDLLTKEKLTKSNFKLFQQNIEKNFAHLGLYWKILVLKECFINL